MTRLLVIGNPENRRMAMLAQAASAAGWEFDPFPYQPLLTNPAGSLPRLARRAATADVIRLESPAENFEVDRQLLHWGCDAAQVEGSAFLSPTAALQLTNDHGRIICPRQYYLGYCELLRRLAQELPDANWMNDPDEVLCMFDKPSTIDRLRAADLPTPPPMGVVRQFDELIEEMTARGWARVFVKIANGSSASGVAAIHHDATTTWALTSVETDCSSGEPRYYNSLKLQRYSGLAAVRGLVEALTPHRLHVEQWLPKATDERGDGFDLRVVVINGQATHGVMRIGSSPMTNLHLGNRRGDYNRLRQQLGPERCQQLDQRCEQVAAVFPHSHYVGLDLMFTPAYKQLYILEANAYGDLLPNVLDDQGLTTHQREIQEWQAGSG